MTGRVKSLPVENTPDVKNSYKGRRLKTRPGTAASMWSLNYSTCCRRMNERQPKRDQSKMFATKSRKTCSFKSAPGCRKTGSTDLEASRLFDTSDPFVDKL